MFYCNECAKEKGYPETIIKSDGLCEVCGKHALCNDMSCSKLPMSKEVNINAFQANNMELKNTLEMIKDLKEFDKSTADAITESGKEYLNQAKAMLIGAPNKVYPIIDVPANGCPNWYEGAFTLYFVYSKHHGNFILRGYRKEVDEYLKKNYTHYFYYVSMWSAGHSRGHWKFWKDDVTIFEPSKSYKSWKYNVVKYKRDNYFNSERVLEIKLKRLPKRWIPEFNNL
jgi:hypothetical protein